MIISFPTQAPHKTEIKVMKQLIGLIIEINPTSYSIYFCILCQDYPESVAILVTSLSKSLSPNALQLS